MSSPAPFPASVLPAPPSVSRWLSGRNGLVLALAVAATLFCVYATFRQRYVWGSDSYGYLEFGKLISEGRVDLPVEYSPTEFPAGIPLGFSANPHGRAAPDYPPGLPLLVAVGHWLRAPMFVTPMVGVISTWFIFLLLRRRAALHTAALFALVWAFLPVTVYGSTLLMSDLVAATALMGVYLAIGRDRMAAAAWALGLAIWVRPTNVLFALPLATILPWDRRMMKLIAHLAVPCLLYAIYNHLQFGAPWKTGYGEVGLDFLREVFWQHAGFYATKSVLVLTPFLFALMILGLAPWRREKLFFLLWALTFFVFYCFWRSGADDRWWWIRFLLPAYPPLFLLAADGFERLRTWMAGMDRVAWRRSAQAALWLAVLVLPVHYVRFGISEHDLWNRDTGATFVRVLRDVDKHVPARNLLGSVEFTGCCLLYSEMVPFWSTHPHSPELVARAVADGRRIFLLVEPWNADQLPIQQLRAAYDFMPVASYEYIWGGLPLYELKPKAVGAVSR